VCREVLESVKEWNVNETFASGGLRFEKIGVLRHPLF
jgi:hypothetical protein